MKNRTDKDFYATLELNFRGDKEEIKERLKVYLPFILPLKEIDNEPTVLDLGCGRGEWLEVARENGFNVIGVDIDDGMIKKAKETGFEIEKEDAISYIQNLKSSSISAITAFHFIEHIPFDDLKILIEEAHRVLKPGGILILETPNAENIKVACENFYLDPTHHKPIPIYLLLFLSEYYNFYRTKVLRLQEPKELKEKSKVNISELFYGVSPDYSIVSQKETKKEFLQKFDTAFDKEYGISLETMLHRFENSLTQIQDQISKANKLAKVAHNEALQAKISAKNVELEAKKYMELYHPVTNSNSWKITKPLREIKSWVRWFYLGVYHWITFSPTSRPRRVVKKLLLLLECKISQNYRLKFFTLSLLDRLPLLKSILKSIIYDTNNNKYKQIKKDYNSLSPRAKDIYLELKDKLKNSETEH